MFKQSENNNPQRVHGSMTKAEKRHAEEWEASMRGAQKSCSQRAAGQDKTEVSYERVASTDSSTRAREIHEEAWRASETSAATRDLARKIMTEVFTHVRVPGSERSE